MATAALRPVAPGDVVVPVATAVMAGSVRPSACSPTASSRFLAASCPTGRVEQAATAATAEIASAAGERAAAAEATEATAAPPAPAVRAGTAETDRKAPGETVVTANLVAISAF